MCTAIAACVFCAQREAVAQNATWRASPPTNLFRSAGNWSTNAIPTGTATFGASGTTSIAGTSGSLAALQFNAGSPAYSFAGQSGFTLTLTGAGIINNSSNAPSFAIGGLNFMNNSSAANATILNSAISNTTFSQFSTAANANITITGLATAFRGSSTAGASTITNTSGLLIFSNTSNAGTARIINNSFTSFDTSSSAASASLTVNKGELDFSGRSTAANASIVVNNGATVTFSENATTGAATIAVNDGTMMLADSATGGQARIATGARGVVDIAGLVVPGAAVGSIEGAGTFLLGNKTLQVGANNLSTTVSGRIAGAGGALQKVGGGTLTLTGANAYGGGTTVLGGVINFSAANSLGTGPITLNGGGLQWAPGNTSDISGRPTTLGAAGGTFDTNGNNVTLASAIGGAGGLIKQGAGTLGLAGANTYAGPTLVNAGGLVVNGSVTSDVTIGAAASLGGNGTIFGNLLVNGTASPGNSIGTLSVAGNYTQSAGSAYVVEVNAAGQSDKIIVAGKAAIQGGTVQIQPAPGTYARNTTYTILTASGGVTGQYAGLGIASNFAFLKPTLSYDANDVYLNLLLDFAGLPGMTNLSSNQRGLANAINASYGNATGDFGSVLDALAQLGAGEGPYALDLLGGEAYSGFATTLVQANRLYQYEVARQMAAARRAGGEAGTRLALAQACDVACDGICPFSAWGGAYGGFGNLPGDGSAHAQTYSSGGLAAGLDYRVMPRPAVRRLGRLFQQHPVAGRSGKQPGHEIARCCLLTHFTASQRRLMTSLMRMSLWRGSLSAMRSARATRALSFIVASPFVRYSKRFFARNSIKSSDPIRLLPSMNGWSLMMK